MLLFIEAGLPRLRDGPKIYEEVPGDFFHAGSASDAPAGCCYGCGVWHAACSGRQGVRQLPTRVSVARLLGSG